MLILGGGFGGVVAAERLAHELSVEHELTLVSESSRFVFYPALVRLAFGRCLPDDPFQVLDCEGVGQLVEIGTERGRSVKPGLKVGICGEHGGEPRSIAFCHEKGLDYVSCSPYRVPVARLAAAQAALADGGHKVRVDK
jgi:phosphoenolpyruvate synthase/pyruvate phosphate dikinase